MVHLKMKILSVFTHHQVVPNLHVFICSAENEDIWKNVLIKQISIPIDFNSMYFFFLLWKSMGNEICLIKTFFQISSFVFSRTNKHIEVWNNLKVSK